MSFFADIPRVGDDMDCEGGDEETSLLVDNDESGCCSTNAVAEEDEKRRLAAPKDKKPLYVAILSIIISIPALVGS
ncbi:hypothetical protein SAMD00019534_097740 [Acytostelium subglobosum LB1]|uniref:hypothetical protein n=1 Tax=Acytostelium subglobosum LB1 TaxID=1410327 RepID=UPI000644E80D|nr:hypothetical protein SAMD00019534_097740 [Acytostelium subglobosum LB1]GAM26599.1 hypothetical protein SAMD00019534_097740 [Acytostelium subglobosum LB1]|eukprot:XP_012750260.1 hypothetical protein SAMD00019534_097740 [Acytostelium subglobosum LB1]